MRRDHRASLLAVERRAVGVTHLVGHVLDTFGAGAQKRVDATHELVGDDDDCAVVVLATCDRSFVRRCELGVLSASDLGGEEHILLEQILPTLGQSLPRFLAGHTGLLGARNQSEEGSEALHRTEANYITREMAFVAIDAASGDLLGVVAETKLQSQVAAPSTSLVDAGNRVLFIENTGVRA